MRSNQVPSKDEKTPPWKPERLRAGLPALVLIGSMVVASLGANGLFYSVPIDLLSRTTSGIVTDKNESIDRTKSGGRVHSRTIKYTFAVKGTTYGRTDLFGLLQEVETELPESVYNTVEVGEKLNIQYLPWAPWINRIQRDWLSRIWEYLLAIGELGTLWLGATYFRRTVFLPFQRNSKKELSDR